MTGSSRGSVQWVPQPGRPRPKPFTAEELARLEKDPYDRLDEVPAPPAEEEERPTSIISYHVKMMLEDSLDQKDGGP